jgi:N-acetylmuramoyl-L-alanine amidase
MRIAINAGHCPGLDSGAVGQTGQQEAEVVRYIANKVCGYLQDVGYETLFIQENELQDICNASNNFNADLFISIHCNAATNDQAQGTETWYFDGSAKGESLAQCIQRQIIDSLQTVDRGVKDAVPHKNGLYVLSNTDATSILVECGFISNAEDECMLASEKGQDELARAISRGVSDHVR